VIPRPTPPQRPAPISVHPVARKVPQLNPAPTGNRVVLRTPTPAPNDAVWVEATSVQVAGAAISGGHFYFGHKLAAVEGWMRGEASLVNPLLPVDFTQPDWAGNCLDYWPTYERLSPEGRAAYLSWLSSPRNSTQVPIGYVFIYFYGLERRVIVDIFPTSKLHHELIWIASEVERLLGIYGSNSSFHHYASNFLSMIRCQLVSGESSVGPPPAIEEHVWCIPPLMQLGLGRLVAGGQAIPADWALAWVQAHPEVHLRTPASRCAKEFAQLFAVRYRERFGEGMVLKPNKRSLKVSYRPASPSIGHEVAIRYDLPDVTELSAPVNALKDLAYLCTDQLDSYSRWLGRHPDEKGSLAAAALLPPELVRNAPSAALDELVQWIQLQLVNRDDAVVDASELVRRWPAQTPGKLKKAEASALAQLLGSQGYGVEPDVRFDGPVLGVGKAVIFRLEGAAATAGPAWESAAAVLQLAAAVAAPSARSDAVLDAVADEIQVALSLPSSEHSRVRAHLCWVASSPSSLTAAKRALAKIDLETRNGIGKFLVDVAAACGDVGPQQVATLTKAYKILGLEPASMYSLVHERTAETSAFEPVEIRPARSVVPGEAIPPPPRRSSALALDQEAIRAKLTESAKAAALLGQIFSEDDPDVPPPTHEVPDAGPLKGAHVCLLQELAARPTWSHVEFAKLASDAGLLPAGALESLNDAALDTCGDLVLVGDDVYEVNPVALKELLP
jgi:hypothetical protein